MAGPDFRESCNRFCRENLCPILMAIIAAGFSVAGSGAAWFLDTYADAQQSEFRDANTTRSLDAHIAQERANTEKVMEALGEIKTDLTVVKYRLDSNRGASVPGPELMASPEHVVSQ
jgi:hypothetical protein